MEIDACGLSCPQQAVILTINAIKSHIKILVDNNVACENIKRLAKDKGFNMQIEKLEKKFQLILTK